MIRGKRRILKDLEILVYDTRKLPFGFHEVYLFNESMATPKPDKEKSTAFNSATIL